MCGQGYVFTKTGEYIDICLYLDVLGEISPFLYFKNANKLLKITKISNNPAQFFMLIW